MLPPIRAWLNAHDFGSRVLFAFAGILLVCLVDLVLGRPGAPDLARCATAALLMLGMDVSLWAHRRGMGFWQAENLYAGADFVCFTVLCTVCFAQAESPPLIAALLLSGFLIGLMNADRERRSGPLAWEQAWSAQMRLAPWDWALLGLQMAVFVVGAFWVGAAAKALVVAAMLRFAAHIRPKRRWLGAPEPLWRRVFAALALCCLGVVWEDLIGVF